MKLSEKIRILRKARGMSQEEFGYSLSEATEGVTRQTVSDWENGKFEPKLDNIRDIARVLGVSFDVLLDESIDLNNAEVLKSVLHNVPQGAKKSIGTKVSYNICQYGLNKKAYIKLSVRIAILAVFVLSVLLLALGLSLRIEPLASVGLIFGAISFALIPTSIIGIHSFAKDYKHPQGAILGELNNTHLFVYAHQTARNVICIPLEKIKDIRISEGNTKRHGDLVISLDGREKPITLPNVAFPQEAIDCYRRILQANDDPDPIQIL